MEAQAVPREAVSGRPGISSRRALRLASDARLVALIRAHSSAAFETVYDRYHRQLFGFCRHMLADPDEAADVVQHTFLAAYDAIVSSEKPILLRAWLFTIARNRCCSILRSRSQHPSDQALELPSEGLAAQVQVREELRQLLVDLRRLPSDQRAALVLAELCTLSHQEIASVLGVPTPKVKALVFQARESLLANRTARDTDCAVIREQLASSHGGALRRGNLRRHLMQCAGCRDYRIQVELQRRHLAAVLPVSCSFAFKDAIGAQLSTGPVAAFGAASGGFLASGTLKGLALKPLLGATMAVLGLAGAVGHGAPSTHRHRAAQGAAARSTRFTPAFAAGVVRLSHQSATRRSTEAAPLVTVSAEDHARQHHAAAATQKRASHAPVAKPAPSSSEPPPAGAPSDDSSPAPTDAAGTPTATPTAAPSVGASQGAGPPADAGATAHSPPLHADEQGASHQHATGRGSLSGETEPVPFSS
jgi:RNA polymerase sigma factor (sigma-70 family)